MFERLINDWDDAYANSQNIPGGEKWPEAWAGPARAFRDKIAAAGLAKLDVAYGEKPRNRLDLFLPATRPKGLVVFVHGGFWLRLDKSYFSHFAAGSLEQGYAVAVPSYTLCPDIRIGGIVGEIAAAIGAAAELVAGPLVLTGHSAGGHLVSRMVSATTPLPAEHLRRIRRVVSISGVHDLRPIMRTAMNEKLSIDEAEALAESPALLRPAEDVRLTCWVGGNERAEFLRQSELLANIWTGVGATTSLVTEPDRHHFTILDGLTDPEHALVRTLLTA